MAKKIVMVGMNPRTRGRIPWDDDCEIWTLNEGPSKDWMKRWDVLFQIHPIWDWNRSNNLADPNHPLFIKAQSGECLYCKGSGKAYGEGKEVKCPWCVDGIYIVPDHRWAEAKETHREETVEDVNIYMHRAAKKIIMQDMNEDVPGCERFPLETIMENFENEGHPKPYFTSTLAHMLVYAIIYHPDAKIELYGFEAESNTEYAVQRPCIEYWVGYGRGLGMSIEAPGSHLLTGRHYAYEDFDQGYRSNLEFRKRELQGMLQNAEIESIKSEAKMDAYTPLKDNYLIKPLWEDAFIDHFKKAGFVAFLRGTLKELNHAIEILDGYRQDSDEATQADRRRLIEVPYILG